MRRTNMIERTTRLILSLLLTAGTTTLLAQELPKEGTASEPTQTVEATASQGTPNQVTTMANLAGTRGDVIVDDAGYYTNTGVLLLPKLSWPFVVAETGTTDVTSGFAIFNSARTRLFTVLGTGDTGIGVANPSAKLEVKGGIIPLRVSSASSAGVALEVTERSDMVGGVVLRLYGSSVFQTNGLQIGYGGAPIINSLTTGPLLLNPWVNKDVVIGSAAHSPNSGLKQLGPSGVSTFAGRVGIGTATPNAAYRLDVVGDASFSGILYAGNIQAKYQDVAEWVESDELLAPGNVVIIDSERNDQVVASTAPYDTRVAGVISDQPGVLLGVPGESKVKVATTGRVRVRVDATTNPIERGDILVTSDKPGTAMKSMPVDIAGMKLHRPGTVVGKALEAMPSGQGEILVLLSLQ